MIENIYTSFMVNQNSLFTFFCDGESLAQIKTFKKTVFRTSEILSGIVKNSNKNVVSK